MCHFLAVNAHFLAVNARAENVKSFEKEQIDFTVNFFLVENNKSGTFRPESGSIGKSHISHQNAVMFTPIFQIFKWLHV